MDKRIGSLLLSLIVTFFLIIKFSINPMVSFLVFIVLTLVFLYSMKKINKKYNKMSLILSGVFTLIYIICDSIEISKTINIFNRYLLLNMSSYFIIFYFSLINLFVFMDKYIRKKEEDRTITIGDKEILSTSKFSFIISFSLIFIVNLLFLIKFYPGNLTYDSYNEISQIKGLFPLMNNHSILHTGLLALFIKFGLLFKSMNLGVFLYSLFQISLVSLLFSYILYFMAKHKVPIIFRIISLLFFAFHPINIFYSFSIWKDILFSLVFVIFTIIIYYLSKDKDYFMNKKNIALFIIISVLLMYLRNNAVYVVLITLLVLFIKYRKTYKRIIPVFISVILTFFISKLLIFNICHINNYEVREMLSVPSQALARIYKNGNINKKEKETIEKFYTNKIGEVYNPIISDNTKGLLNQDYFKKHKGEYIKFNLKLFFTHNKEYMESFISNNYGYYYMNSYYPSIILQKTDDLGVKHANIDFLFIFLLLTLISIAIVLIVLWNLKDKKNILLFGLLVPVFLGLSFSIKDNSLISLLFNIGFYVTIIFLTLIYNIKNKNSVIYYIPSIILWITILFSPVYAEFRYLYPLFILVPIFIGMTMKKIDE